MGKPAVGIGVIGLGSAGSLHARSIRDGKIPGAATLSAVVCRPDRLRSFEPALPADMRRYDTLDALLSHGDACDAVNVATPHIRHPEQTIAALRAGLHVFSEKPARIRASEACAMADAADRHRRVYELNYNRRTVPFYQTIRAVVQGGEIGTLCRVSL